MIMFVLSGKTIVASAGAEFDKKWSHPKVCLTLLQYCTFCGRWRHALISDIIAVLTGGTQVNKLVRCLDSCLSQ